MRMRVTVEPTALELEMLRCYANHVNEGSVETAVLDLALQTARPALERGGRLEQEWQRHLERLAERVAQPR